MRSLCLLTAYSLLLTLSSCAWLLRKDRIPANRGVVHEHEGVYYSPRLKKKIPYWVAMPINPENKVLPVVYFLHGRDGSRHLFRELGGPGVLERYLGNGGTTYAVVTLTGSWRGHNTYWIDQPAGRKLPWASLILKELIPYIEAKHKIGGHWSKRMIAGISMGSHGAFQLALNSKGLFKCVAGHSLVVRDYDSMEAHFPGLFGTPLDFAKRDPLTLLRRIPTRRQVPFQKVWVDIGGADEAKFLEWDAQMAQELRRLGFSEKRGDKLDIGQEFPRGDHTYVYWTKRLPEYLNWYGQCLTPPQAARPATVRKTN